MFPFADRRNTGVKNRGQHSLAELKLFTHGTDICAAVCRDGIQTKHVVLIHCALADESVSMQIARRFMYGRKYGAFCSRNFTGHGKLPVMIHLQQLLLLAIRPIAASLSLTVEEP